MRLIAHRRLQTPGFGIAQEVRQQQRAGGGGVSGRPQRPLDRGEDGRVLERGRGAVSKQLLTETFADADLEIGHHRVHGYVRTHRRRGRHYVR